MASIDIFSMANSYHENSNFFVLNFSDDAIISDTILPKASKICGKGLAKLPRVFINGNFIKSAVKLWPSGQRYKALLDFLYFQFGVRWFSIYCFNTARGAPPQLPAK